MRKLFCIIHDLIATLKTFDETRHEETANLAKLTA